MHDSNKPDDPPANLPTDIEQRVEDLAERFLEELQAGKSPDREQWVKAHPEIAQPLAARLELVEKMFRMVHGSGARGPRAEAAEHAGRPHAPHQPTSAPQPPERAIHLKCPHCGNRIQLVEPSPHEVLCENCGSSFELAPGTTTTYRPDDLPKTIGRFQVLELLGRGGFGAVYKARDAELDRTVAIKVPRAGYFGTQQEQERFLREARNAARLKHPNIVPVHEIGHDRGVPYIVSDYVEGLTLADLLTAGRPTFRESAELVARIADALDYAHREKVIHRDIKPSNILIQKVEGGGSRVEGQRSEVSPGSRPSTLDSRPFLTDFGLARRDEGEITVTLDGQVLGTPAYMPPEQAAGDQRKVDARSDVYSLGVVLYELLTGELPFRGNKRMLLHQVLNDDPRPPRSLNDRIPRDLETICLKSMSKEPARRYPTARELADDLRRYLTGDPIHARPVSKLERFWHWSRRNPAIATLTGLAALALLAVASVSLSFAIYHSRASQRFSNLFGESEKNRIRAEENAAGILIDHALTYIEWDQQELGLLWLSRALRATPTEAKNIERRIRIILAIWGQSLSTRDGVLEHQDGVNSAFFTHDGREIVTICNDGSVRLWNAATRREHVVFESRPHGSNPLAVSSDGKLVATTFDRVTEMWDLATGTPIGSPMQHPSKVQDAFFSRDGRMLSTRTQRTGHVWEAATSKAIGSHLDDEYPVAISIDGQAMVTRIADNSVLGRVRIRNCLTGDLLEVSGPLENARQPVNFSWDGRMLLTAHDDGTARLWTVGSWRPLGKTLEHATESAAFSRNSQQVLTGGSDGTVLLWEVASGARLSPKPLRTRFGVVEVAFSRDGKFILTEDGDGDNDPVTSTLWDSSSGDRICEFPDGWPISFSQINHTVVTFGWSEEYGRSAARIWELLPAEGSREMLELWTEVIARMELSPDDLGIKLDEEAWQERRQRLEDMASSSPCSSFVRRAANDHLHWVRREAREAEESNNRSVAVPLLDRLIEGDPNNWRLYDRQGDAYMGLRAYDKACMVYSNAKVLGGNDWFRPRYATSPSVDVRWLNLGRLQLYRGNLAGYRQLCSESLERFSDTHNAITADRVARLCMLFPDAVADLAPAVQCAEMASSARPSLKECMTTRGAILYRVRRYAEAVELLSQVTATYKKSSSPWQEWEFPTPWLFLAMAHYHSNDTDEANKWLDKAANWIAENGSHWLSYGQWIEWQILLREAQSLIRGENR